MCGYALSRLLPYWAFEFVEYLSMLAFDFFMNYNKAILVKHYWLMLTILYTCNHYTEIYHLYLKRERVINGVIKLMCTVFDEKKNMYVELVKQVKQASVQALKHGLILGTCIHKI